MAKCKRCGKKGIKDVFKQAINFVHTRFSHERAKAIEMKKESDLKNSDFEYGPRRVRDLDVKSSRQTSAISFDTLCPPNESLYRPKNLKTLSDFENFRDYVVLDTETTGINRTRDYIINIAMIKYRDGMEVDKFDALVKPPISIPPSATAVNGISNAMVAVRLPFSSIAVSVADFIGDNCVVGHNVSFDLAFVLRECGCSIKCDCIRYVDTIGLAKRAFPDEPNYKLNTLIRDLGIASSQAHRAMADAVDTAALFRKCCDKLTSDLAQERDDILRQRELKKEAQAKVIEQCSVSPLYKKSFVFTGDFKAFERSDCENTLANVGAYYRTSVSSKTDYLVKGISNMQDDSSKLTKAYELISAGSPMRIITENEYLELLTNARSVLSETK